MNRRNPTPGSLWLRRQSLAALAGLLLVGCASPSARPPASPSSPQGSESSTATDSASSSRPKTNSSSSTQPTASSSKAASRESANDADRPSGAMTEEEREQAWNESFDVALGDFDKRIARERIEIEQQQEADRDRHGGAGDAIEGDGEGYGEAGTIPGEIEGDGEVAAIGTGVGGGRGQPHSGPRFPAPEGTPDGHDDDVVARQLREAAETETDPELRRRLWEEYRKYKTGS